MLNTGHTQIKLSQYRCLYDLIIPKDNFLRKIKENIDFSFVNPLLEKSYCKYYGRPATEPELMFKLLFLKRMYDLSDVELIERASVDMSFKYFLDLDPEDKLVDDSLLTKFRRSRINSEEILEEMLTETVRQAIEKRLIKSNSIIVDATHTKSKGNSETPTQMLRRLTKELRKKIYASKPELASQFPEKPSDTATLEIEITYAKELVNVLEKNITQNDNIKLQNKFNQVKDLLKNDKIKEIQSVVDEDAKLGYKSETNSFFGYKNHIAMTEDRIITAIEITSGEAPDGKYLKNLIEKSKKNGIEVAEVLGDKAYAGKENLEYAKEEAIKIISRMNPVISNGNRTGDDGFEYIKDADMVKCPMGHLCIRKSRTGKKNGTTKNQAMKYYFDIEKCKECKLMGQCYKKNAKSKTYSISILSDTHKEQKEFEETEYFKERIKQRYMIEAKNAELKQAHGLDKCKYLGLSGMRMQTYFTVFVGNIKRIMRLMELKMVSSSMFFYNLRYLYV